MIHRVEVLEIDRVDVFEQGREGLVDPEGGERGRVGVNDCAREERDGRSCQSYVQHIYVVGTTEQSEDSVLVCSRI